jgi:DNA-nicking Smr family endonuclease
MLKKSAINSTEDAVLWQRVTSQVTPLKSTNQSDEFANLFAGTSEPQKKPLRKTTKTQKKLAPVDASARSTVTVTKIGTSKQPNPVDLRHGQKAGIDRGTQRRLFRGEVPVDSRLDLHGLNAAQAQNQLAQFIESSVYQRCRCVLVITGKGSGVLHGYVPNWLKRHPLARHILALAEARPKDGGGGALYVLLRRKRDGK